jgi:hypothetical protein
MGEYSICCDDFCYPWGMATFREYSVLRQLLDCCLRPRLDQPIANTASPLMTTGLTALISTPIHPPESRIAETSVAKGSYTLTGADNSFDPCRDG